MRTPVLIALLFASLHLKGQAAYSWTPYSDLIKEIDLLQETKYDTVLAFMYVRGYPELNESELKGIGKLAVQSHAIIIGLKNNNVSLVRLVGTYETIFNSKPINLTTDSTLSILRNLVPFFRTEAFLPYVWEVHADNSLRTKGFFTNESGLHEPFQTLYLKSKSESSLKEFIFESLNETYLNSDILPPNLNFAYNRSLKLFELYSILVRLTSEFETHFDFAK